MLIKSLEAGVFAANCYLASCEVTREGILIDTGAQAAEILRMVQSAQVTVTCIVSTHGHIDHVGAAADVRDALGVPLLIHEADSEMIRHPHDDLGAYFGTVKPAQPDRLLQDGEKLTFGKAVLRVITTPGHSRGSVCLYGEDVLFSGDTLFAGSIGRTDLPGGSFVQIIRSIKEKLLVLPAATVVYPGHGPATTIAEEIKYNPFLR